MRSMPRTPPIAIVGSGLDALTAAFRLRQSGARVAWFPELETPRAPGPFDSSTLRRADLLEPLEVPSSAPALFGLVAELGLGKSIRRSTRPPLCYVLPSAPGLRTAAVRGQPLRSGPRGILARRRVRRLLRWYGPWNHGHAPELGARLDDRSVADWTRLYLSSRNLDRLYAPFLAFHFGLDAQEASRLLLLPLLDVHGRPRLDPIEGTDELVHQLETALADVKQASPVRRVEAGGEKIRLANGRFRKASATILAVPADRVVATADALTPAEIDSLAQIRYADRVDLELTVARVPALRGSSIAPVRAHPCADFWIASNLPSTSAGARVRSAEGERFAFRLRAAPAWAAHSAGATEDWLASQLVESAEVHWPGLRREIQALEVRRRPASTPWFRVGHFRAVARLYEESTHCLERKLFLCGEYQIAPHLEAAVLAGERAAERCLHELGTRTRSTTPLLPNTEVGAEVSG